MRIRPAVEPPADVRHAAASAYQLFVAYRQAGFTERQAIALILGLIAASNGGGK